MTDAVSTGATGDGGNPAPAAAPAAPAAAPAPAAPWYGTFDQDTVGWLENRGLTKLEATAALPEVIKGFRNAEKYIGVPAEQIVRLPKADAPQEAWNDVYTKLGRPADPNGYEVKIPEGVDGSFADWAKNSFHELGISKTQGEQLASRWNEFVGKQTEVSQAQYKNTVAEQNNALRAEWGQAYDQNVNIAKRAAQEFGIDAQTVDKLEQSLGFDGVFKMLHNIGSKIGESSFTAGEAQSAISTPNAAVAKIKMLQQDKGFVEKYIAGNAEARAQMEALHKQAYGQL